MLNYELFKQYVESIGCKVRKPKKPFKSGLKENTVRGIIVHPQLQRPAFIFYEDDSYVSCDRCTLS